MQTHTTQKGKSKRISQHKEERNISKNEREKKKAGSLNAAVICAEGAARGRKVDLKGSFALQGQGQLRRLRARDTYMSGIIKIAGKCATVCAHSQESANKENKKRESEI
jgi:hypothetical protein